MSSHVWRQDHNGFTHQDPGFIDHVIEAARKHCTEGAGIWQWASNDQQGARRPVLLVLQAVERRADSQALPATPTSSLEDTLP